MKEPCCRACRTGSTNCAGSGGAIPQAGPDAGGAPGGNPELLPDLGVVGEANGNIKSLLRRGRGYKNLRYLLLKAQRMAVTNTEFVVFKKAA